MIPCKAWKLEESFSYLSRVSFSFKKKRRETKRKDYIMFRSILSLSLSLPLPFPHLLLLFTSITLFICNFNCVSGQIQTGAPWPVYGRNQLHTANSPFLIESPTTGKLRWKLFMGSQIQSSPSIGADGTIYFGTDSGLVYAVSSLGDIIWKYQTRGPVLATPALSVKDMLFFGSWDKSFYALQASTGTMLWSYKTSDSISSSAIIDSSNTVYFGAGSNVYALLDTGFVKWKATVRGKIDTSPALSLDGILFLTNSASSLPFSSFISLNSSDGSKYIDPSFFSGEQVVYSSPLVSKYLQRMFLLLFYFSMNSRDPHLS